jgi:hypothetical protein
MSKRVVGNVEHVDVVMVFEISMLHKLFGWTELNLKR